MVIEDRVSLRTSLLILVLACALPPPALCAVLLVRQDPQQREPRRAVAQCAIPWMRWS